MPGFVSPTGKKPAKSAGKIKIAALRGSNRKSSRGKSVRAASANTHKP